MANNVPIYYPFKFVRSNRAAMFELMEDIVDYFMSSDDYMDNDWLNSFFEDPVLNDKMITDAVPTPRIRSEHSYSTINNDPTSPFGLTKIEELDFFGNNQALDLSGTTGTPHKSIPEMSINLTQSLLNVTPKNEPDPTSLPTITTTTTRSSVLTKHQPTIILATSTHSQPTQVEHVISHTAPIVTIKTEPQDFIDYSDNSVNIDSLPLPPTPPSSSCSDSDGGLSPQRSAPSSPIRHMPMKASHCSSLSPSSSKPYSQPFFTNPIPQSGVLILSEEEKRTLISEGYPVPNKLPLTKQEEKNLKKIRRKIKNKISAQESRRKKKEYVEALEKRVESFSQENNDLKKKMEMLETNNRSLIGQLHKLQNIVGKVTRTTSNGTGTVLMVLVLCFAVFLGNWTPSSLNIGYSTSSSMSMNGGASLFSNPRLLQPSPRMGPSVQNPKVDAYSTPNMKSRVLLSLFEELEDSTRYYPYGPITPGGTGKESLSHDLVKTCEKGPEISPPTSDDKTAKKIEVVTVDARIGNGNATINEKDAAQAIMHPDISASADFLQQSGSKAVDVETA
ncbi:cyclic AMP-responsive element-binding protein 3-like protein 2 isoform X3 [Mytilus trossulus]|uniref:cyclic AMP-responsive element-binding protein 3-like protein 2 isoform X3 n=1 Tax=Mytilus trossulus TaxID=6551 RepID=UPI0030069E71